MLAQRRAAEDRYKRWSDKRLAHGAPLLSPTIAARPALQRMVAVQKRSLQRRAKLPARSMRVGGANVLIRTGER
jgi:hypothetical protein